MKEMFAQCSHCDYRTWYYDPWFNYSYGIGRYFEYPKIKYAWCEDCKDFKAIQCGINFLDIEKYIKIQENELSKLESKFFKFSKTKESIKEYQFNIEHFKKLANILNHKNSVNSCLKCGGSNLVYKDIEHELWGCPKCRIGILMLEEEEDSRLYTIGETVIHPIMKGSEKKSNLPYWIFKCAMDMIQNENLVWVYINKEPEKIITSDCIKYSAIDRCSLIVAYLSCLMKYDVSYKMVAYCLYHESDVFNEIEEKDFMQYFSVRYEFFETELNIMKGSKFFLPGKIIYLLYNPKIEDINHRLDNQFCDNLKDSFSIWNTVSYTLRAYFNDYKVL